MVWTYLTTAPDQITAEMWVELLRNEGIDATLDPRDATSYLGVTATPCRVLVAPEDVGRARAALSQHGLGPDDSAE